MIPTIAIICNYVLRDDRIGGMDYFFWAFDQAFKTKGLALDWYFPNNSAHPNYKSLHIIPALEQTLEQHFLDHTKRQQSSYSHIMTHFVGLCTPFYKAVKQLHSTAVVIGVDHNPRPLEGYAVQKRVKKRLQGIIYGQYIDQFVGVSNYTCHELVKDFGSSLKPKIKTIYNGIKINSIRERGERSPQSAARFLVVSHLRQSKGIQDLIKAVAQLPPEVKVKISIDIYGEGPQELFLKDLTSKHDLTKQIVFKGSSDSIHRLYADYDYMIQPTHMECFSLSILESLAANVPVITTPVGGNTEVIIDDENGWLFKAKDIDALTKLLASVLRGECQINNNTRSNIQARFSIDMMVAQYSNLIVQ